MPRKSTASTADPGASAGVLPATGQLNVDGDTSIMSATTDISPSSKPAKTNTKADKGDAENTGIDDLLLPRTLTSRLARGTLPPNTSIQKDALLALTKAASVFISYLASHANEATTKKTIGPADVIKALQEIEMAQVMGIGEVGRDGKVGGRLERELEVWENVVRGKRKGYREKVKMRESGVGGEGEEDGTEREAKRARMEEEVEVEGSGKKHTAPPHAGHASQDQTLTNGADNGQAGGDVDIHDDDGDGEDEAYDEGSPSADGDSDGDETQPDEEDDPDDDEEPAPDEEDLDGFGPEDQLRQEINGDETGDESE